MDKMPYEELTALAAAIASAASKSMSGQELNLLGNLLMLAGTAMQTVASFRELGENNDPKP